MPRAAILLALLLIFHDPAAPQSPGARGAALRAASGRSFAPPSFLHDVSALRGWSASPSAGPPPGGAGAVFFQSDDPDSASPPRVKKSSWTAVALSAVLPGAGQIYTENYWKVPIIWGLGGYWVYEWTRNHDRYKEFRDLYSGSIADSPPNGDERYLKLREFYKDQRDSFAWYLGVLYFLNIVDAYVGAELYDFDVGPDLGAGSGGGVHASLTIRF